MAVLFSRQLLIGRCSSLRSSGTPQVAVIVAVQFFTFLRQNLCEESVRRADETCILSFLYIKIICCFDSSDDL